MVRSFSGTLPRIAPSAYIDETAQVIGDVEIGERSSVWMGVVVRGDVNYIRIGAETNIQDNAVLHVMKDLHPLLVGDRVTVGHGATLHGCRVESDCLIGMGAIVLNGARVGSGSIIGVGAVVTEGTVVPPNSANGQNWYWYEVLSTTDGDRLAGAGKGVPLCVGCHFRGKDFVLSVYPLQR